MKVFLGSFEFKLLELKGLEEVFFGISFEIIMSGKYDLDRVVIGDMIEIGQWKGRVVFWSKEATGVHSEGFFRCGFVSTFQYICGSIRYNIYKNLDFKSIAKEILAQGDLESRLLCGSGKNYLQLVQHGDSNQDFIKHLCSDNKVYLYIDPKEDALILIDQFRESGKPLEFLLEGIESESRATDFRISSAKFAYEHITTDSRNNYHSNDHGQLNFVRLKDQTRSRDMLKSFAGNQKIFCMTSSNLIASMSTHNSSLSIGSLVKLKDKDTIYIVLQIKHFFDLDGYRNELLIVEKGSEIVPAYPLPNIIGPQIAKVVGHERSSVQVSFDWSNSKTLLASVPQLFASEKQGAFFLPQYGDSVLVYFQAGSRCNAFVQGSIYTDAALPAYNLSSIRSIRTKSNSDDAEYIEFLIDPNSGFLKFSSFGDLYEEIGGEKVVKISKGPFFLEISEGKAFLKLDQNSLFLHTSEEIVLETSKVKVKTSSINFLFEELKLSGNKIEMISDSLLLDSKGILVQSPEFKIKSSKVEIS